MNRDEMMALIADRIGGAALLELLAEESAELGHAALKLARRLRCENPTPVTVEEAEKRLAEEMADVILVAKVLKIQGIRFDNNEIGARKLKRWVDRVNAGGV